MNRCLRVMLNLKCNIQILTPLENIMNFKGIIVTSSIISFTSLAVAEPPTKAIDLKRLYASYEKSGYSSLELIESTKNVLISGVVLDVTQSFKGNSILKVGVRTDTRELARLAAADDSQETKLKALQVGDTFNAVCDLAFTSGAQYMSFQECVFK